MVDLIGKKFYFFGFSILIIIAGLVGYFVNGGFQMDIQFQGGSIMELQLNENTFNGMNEKQAQDKKAEIQKQAEEIVKTTVNKNASAQISTTLNSNDAGKKIDLLTVNIGTALQGKEQTTLVTALKADKVLSIKSDAQMQIQNVQPFIGKEIRNGALWAIFWASILIIFYVWWRFKALSGPSAGVMAILALLHDILIVLSVYAIFKIPLNDAFIAAVLTVIGYSMNDTIIIYDRIRENSNMLRKMPVGELVNKSILQTLNRSINTVVTVLICIVTVYAFAKYNNIKSIAEFSLPMIVGIASGCYSSIFIASPLWVLWKEGQEKRRIAAKAMAKA